MTLKFGGGGPPVHPLTMLYLGTTSIARTSFLGGFGLDDLGWCYRHKPVGPSLKSFVGLSPISFKGTLVWIAVIQCWCIAYLKTEDDAGKL